MQRIHAVWFAYGSMALSRLVIDLAPACRFFKQYGVAVLWKASPRFTATPCMSQNHIGKRAQGQMITEKCQAVLAMLASLLASSKLNGLSMQQRRYLRMTPVEVLRQRVKELQTRYRASANIADLHYLREAEVCLKKIAFLQRAQQRNHHEACICKTQTQT